MLAASPKGTVPVLVLPGGEVIDESLDVMLWALRRNDPEQWLAPAQGSVDDMLALIAGNDGAFKRSLDRYKYPNRYAEESAGDANAFALQQRGLGAAWLLSSTACSQAAGCSVRAPAWPTWRCCPLFASSRIPTRPGSPPSPGQRLQAGWRSLRRARCMRA
jgi:hypothetical protein